jgi:hypothetical protein
MCTSISCAVEAELRPSNLRPPTLGATFLMTTCDGLTPAAAATCALKAVWMPPTSLVKVERVVLSVTVAVICFV